MFQTKEKRDPSGVTDFYDGKSIFMTGATGFIGVVLLETFLRLCTGIERIYILVREKKGASPEKRKQDLFKKTIFNTLREEKPEVFQKVYLVPGEITQPNLGISQEDLTKIIEDVTIVFHCAASISFFKGIEFLIEQNVKGVYSIIELCRKLNHCEALLYTSTAFGNYNRNLPVEERVYKLPYPAKRFLHAFESGNHDLLQRLTSECKPDWPNYYTFSKCIAENLLVEEDYDFPLAIIRPSIVVNPWKGPMPGFFEGSSVMSVISAAIGQGFLKYIPGEPKTNMDLVPADVVANAHVITAWKVATQRCSSPFIVNCVAYNFCKIPLSELIQKIADLQKEYPLPNSLRISHSCVVTNQPVYKAFLSLYEHYIPALGMDALLLFQGKKTRLVSAYRSLDNMIDKSSHFLSYHKEFEDENFRNLHAALKEEEKKILYADLTGLTLDGILSTWPQGNPCFDWTSDKKSKSERIKFAKRMAFFTVLMQITSIIFLGCLLMLVFSRVFQISLL